MSALTKSIFLFGEIYYCNPNLGLAIKARACKGAGQE